MAREMRDDSGALIDRELSHTAQQADDGIDAAKAVWDLFRSITDAGETSY